MQAALREASPIRGRGYTLAALMIIIAVMSIGLGVAMPLWSHAAQREKEAELVFRGLQYAEAVRVFQRRFGRLPTKLDELIEVQPRSIRQLYPEPMAEDGQWGLIFAQQRGRGGRQGAQQTRQRAGQPAREQAERPARGGRDRQPFETVQFRPPEDSLPGRDGRTVQAFGPIVGVYSLSSESSIRTFNGASQYDQWQFTVNLIPTPGIVPGSTVIPRPTSEWIGKGFAGVDQLQADGRPLVLPDSGLEPTQPGFRQTPGAQQGRVPGLQRQPAGRGRQPRQQRPQPGLQRRPAGRPDSQSDGDN